MCQIWWPYPTLFENGKAPVQMQIFIQTFNVNNILLYVYYEELLFFQALNFLWLKVLAFSTTSFHFSRSWMQATQFFIFIWQMSCLMLSSHLYLGLPCGLLVRGFQLNIFLTVLASFVHDQTN
jgi:hypothetical protein